MGKSLKEAKRLHREREDKRLGTNPELRKIDRMLCDDAEVRNKERALLGKVVSSKIIRRGGLTKERNKELQALFEKAKCLPWREKEIAAEKALREAGVRELQEKLQQIEEARAAGVTSYKDQEACLQTRDLASEHPQASHPAKEQVEGGRMEEAKPDGAVQDKWAGIVLPLR